jgi:hypothetical protein
VTIVVKLFAIGLIAWLGAFMLLVAIRILRGDIDTTGMLVTDPNRTGNVDPERAIAMGVAPAVLAFYVIHTLNTGAVPLPNGGLSMPDLSEGLVSLLTGSNGLYLAGKIARRNPGETARSSRGKKS